MAELDLERAENCIAKALSNTESFELPLANWRAHATAAELYERVAKIGLMNIIASSVLKAF